MPLNPEREFVTGIGLLYPMEHGLKHIPSIILSGQEINRGVIITANPDAARVGEAIPMPAQKETDVREQNRIRRR